MSRLQNVLHKDNIQKSNKCMKRHLTSFVTNGIQIKIKISLYIIIKAGVKTDNAVRWQGCMPQTLVLCGWGCELVQPVWKTGQHHLPKLNACRSPSKSTLIYIANRNACFLSLKDICKDVHCSVFLNSPKLERHKCPKAGEWKINRGIFIRKYYIENKIN